MRTLGRVARWRRAELLVSLLVPGGSRRGSTWFGRLGDVSQQPLTWAALAAGLALGAGPRGKRAATRGAVSYGVAAVVANVGIKPWVARGRPPRAGKGRTGPVTSSFPSGHAATDMAFSLAAAQEMGVLLVPLAFLTTAAHWSLVRSRGHYPSDVLGGGAVGVAVALVVWRLWPPGSGTLPFTTARDAGMGFRSEGGEPAAS